MSSVRLCHSITRQLYETVSGVDDDNREAIIGKIEKMLEERQILLEGIRPPFSAEEYLMGKQMMEWNRAIDRTLIGLRNDIKRDMNGLTKKKTNVKRYANPYENMQHDGMFYDKKK
ncbi:flagellar assembly protein FliT [Rossellomorea vietnamensis]|uniref:Flagellar assembly protein FliT n=1 Tax=Rossellomorea vietnamensis TaxID=218284 RepID=A0ACD4C4T6_9BACI|nr:flagellar assembly protein FliT [Rossellomorea vietnamensis]UXH43442.1 flagellar assembly protein FliT [Rossellomorea vietnamensis]